MRLKAVVAASTLCAAVVALAGIYWEDFARAYSLRVVGPVTFHGRVVRILRDNCQSCHRAKGPAPFPLETYAQAYARRDRLPDAVRSGRMPLWSADPNVGEWSNARDLPELDRVALMAWVSQGAPEGDPAEAPPPIDWPKGWTIEPDLVLTVPQPVSVPREGTLPYQYAYVPTELSEDRWIQAMEIRPRVPAVLHHALVFTEEPVLGMSPVFTARPIEMGSDFGSGLDGYFMAYGPGHDRVVYPPGHAKLLPKGATLKFQLHYAPNGTATQDQPAIGFVFADRPPTERVETGSVTTTSFVIPPGAKRHEVTAVHRFPEPVRLVGFLPHMHLRGVAFRYELHYLDGRRETILDVPRYQFNWQEEYIPQEPIEVPAGAWLRATGWFNNSNANPANPDPTQTVRFGEQTYEEMMVGFFSYAVPHAEDETVP